MSYTREELSQLTRKELQKLCKQTGGRVKANKKTFELVNDLAEYFEREENEMKEMEAEMKLLDKVDLNSTWTMESANTSLDNSIQKDTIESANASLDNSTGKDTMKLANASLDNSIGKDIMESANASLNNSIRKDTSEVLAQETFLVEEVSEDENANSKLLKEKLMEEVDRRAEERLSKIPRFVADKVIIPPAASVTQSAAATQATPEVAKQEKKGLKVTDSIDIYLAKKKKRAEGQLNFNEKSKENKRMKMSKSASSMLGNKRKSVKIDHEISINFAPQVKSTPNVKRVSPRITKMGDNRRSVVNKSINKSGMEQRRVTLGCITPGSSKMQTPKQKTPIKFDIKASLKKPLRYKPHTGKLKQVYFSGEDNTSLPRKPIANQLNKAVDKKVSLKEMNKNVSTREKRRKDAADQRSKKRVVVLDKRRGIMS